MCNYIWDYDVATGEPIKLYIFDEPDQEDQEPDEPAQEPDEELPL